MVGRWFHGLPVSLILWLHGDKLLSDRDFLAEESLPPPFETVDILVLSVDELWTEKKYHQGRVNN